MLSLAARRIGIIGGTFNPIHNAHLLMARKAQQEFALQQVVFIPAGNPPHKKGQVITDQEHRFKMVELAVEAEPTFSVSRIELDRPGPHYAVETFTALRQLYGESAQLYYIIGMDSLNEILTWRDPERLFSLCQFIVAERPGSSRETFDRLVAGSALLQRELGKINFVELHEDVSSTGIRNIFSRAGDVADLIPAVVSDYIGWYGLYNSPSRAKRAAIYPERFYVPREKAPWSVDYPWYEPPYCIAQVVLDNDVTTKQNGWADPEDFSKVTHPYTSYEGPIRFDNGGIPLNPKGRTGIGGRGLLGKWGANFAADPIITRINTETGELEMIAIRRRDTGEWAIPGGMVDDGESLSLTLARELREETGAKLDMNHAVEIYRGYVDDPRNTDNAWLETVAKHRHLSPKAAARIRLKAGDDAGAVAWLPLNESNLRQLYADHERFVRLAISKMPIKGA